MLKDLLQGKWLNHPLHPIMVSIPLGLWPISLLLDLSSMCRGGSAAAETGAFYCIVVGVFGSAAAAITGLADFAEIKPGKPARSIGYLHLFLNALASIFWIGSAAFHWPAVNESLVRVPTGALVCSIIGLLLSATAAYLGARMVYEYGIGIGRFSKYRLRQIAAAAHNNIPRAKEDEA